MNICGLVVHTLTGQGPAVAAAVGGLPGVEVHARDGERLVVTVEDAPGRPAADTLGVLSAADGVLSTVLVYHYGGVDLEDNPITAEPIQSEEEPP